MDLERRTLAALDWPQVLRALSERAHTPMGERAAVSLRPLTDLEDVLAIYDAVDEVRILEERATDLPVGEVGDVGPLVGRAGRGDVLGKGDLRELGRALAGLDRVARVLFGVEEECPTLGVLAPELDVDAEVSRTLDRAFDDHGELSAAAYPELGELREAITSLHHQIRRTLEDLISGDALGDILQDRYVTQRGDRYVIPVKAHAKRWDLGIVHGASGSGATVFVEPQQVVELNNRLRLAEAAIEAEERRILGELTLLVASVADEVEVALEAVTLLDLVLARSDLGHVLGATRPTVRQHGVVELRQARHPLLQLRGVDVVPNDLGVSRRAPGLVLTGPNTGGKTVALKTVGLCALMVQVGLLVPAEAGSRVDLFGAVLADIGDAQTVHEDLSSFSAHLLVLDAMLEQAAPGDLFLLDEIATGTDPSQGAALARAVLEALVERGPRVVVTTHYGALKGLSAADPRFAVAAMEYREGRPTYRVLAGSVGESRGLATAERLGLDPDVVARAHAVMDRSEAELTRAMEALDATRHEAAAEARRATELADELDRQRVRLARREAELKERTRALEEAAAAAYLERLAAAERAIGQVVADLQRAPDHRRAAAARASVQSLRALVPEPPAPAPVDPPAELRVGDRVRVRTLGRTGEVLQVGDVVAVRVGPAQVRVQPTELELVERAPDPAPRPRRRKQRRAKVPRADLTEAVRLPTNTLDMRGMRVEEGQDAAEAFFDRALLADYERVFLLHGHGTGALKQAMRGWLGSCPYVRAWVPATAMQGGDAYTVVQLQHR